MKIKLVANRKVRLDKYISDKMSIKDINEYIRRYQSGEHVHEILPPGLTKEELIQLQNLADKRT